MNSLIGWSFVFGLCLFGAVGCQQDSDQRQGLNRAAVDRVAQSIARGGNQVGVEDLAGWIIEETTAFELIDVRDAANYQAGHIDKAISLPVAELLGSDGLDNLPDDRKIVLYSQGTDNAARAAVILQLAGLDAHTLTGGYDRWLRVMTDPDAVREAGDASSQARRQAVQCYFEGDYLPEAGLIVKATGSAGYMPPLQPVEAKPSADPLGLGLGIEAGPEQAPSTPDVGLGGGGAPAGLLIGEGC
ncbi:MAG: rhodanese-like domain-containing protein [Pseudomonadota bacterium]|nr:rhodanese-like domain-containing protein [Pseudomonadota bacterium]